VLTFNTFYQNQSQIELSLYQILPSKNHLTGKLLIYAIPAVGQAMPYKIYTGYDGKKIGQPQIHVKLVFNENGVIKSTEAWDSKLKVELVTEWDSVVAGLTKSEIAELREKL